jgi:hypothetical protein
MIATRGNCAFASIDDPCKVGSSQSRRPDGNGGRDTVTALRPHSNPKRPPVVCRSPKAEPLHRIAAPARELPAARIAARAATASADDLSLERVINTFHEDAIPTTAID